MASPPDESPSVVVDSVSVGEGLECPDCHEIVIAKGKMPPKAALGLHRRKEHGYISERARKRKPKGEREPRASSPASSDRVRPLALVTDTAAGVKGKRPPTAEQLTSAFAKLYGYASYGVWSLVLDGDPNIPNEAAHEQAIEMLAASPEQSLATVRPLARLAAGSGLNRRFGRGVVDNVDVVESLAAIFEQARAARAYFRARAQAGVPGAPAVSGTAPGSAPSGAPGPTTAPRESMGILVTPGMVNGNGNNVPHEVVGAGPEGE